MPFADPTDTVQAVLTDQGRDLLARSLLGSVSLVLQGFRVGREGYLDANPVKIDPVDTADTDLQDTVWPFPITGLAPFTAVERPLASVVAAVCRLNRGDCLFGLGEIGVWARVLRATTVAQLQYTALTGGLAFTARQPGLPGNAITFEIVVAGLNTPLSVSVAGSAITVLSATDGAGAATTTVDQAATAIRLDGLSNALVAVQVTGDPLDIVTALAPTNLTGGGIPDPVFGEGQDYLFALAHFPLLAKTDRHVVVMRMVFAL